MNPNIGPKQITQSLLEHGASTATEILSPRLGAVRVGLGQPPGRAPTSPQCWFRLSYILCTCIQQCTRIYIYIYIYAFSGDICTCILYNVIYIYIYIHTFLSMYFLNVEVKQSPPLTDNFDRCIGPASPQSFFHPTWVCHCERKSTIQFVFMLQRTKAHWNI